eukprot:CAMPEP_0201943294 /NCGR_PEP_ID=MMETSP0903-20130614/50800_1 /ASSEMBLY_ACC=CAM_ASM_000552 /TAXON_ID=420261 /ORGANISM="Thalassiosira antarctica, Strain CCMP982" /LENGTH=210 /DNA_ID=CAMNT_0048485935 /DNA_START=260 /DNA_END=889 /DNA_ORIENTATION=-
MTIDSMGSLPWSLPPKTNGANAAPLSVNDSNMMDISPPEKQDEPVPETNGLANGSAPKNVSSNDQALAAPTMEISTANEANGSRKIPLADESIEDELRPAKKQKQESSSMDVSPDTSDNGATSASNKDANELVQVAPDRNDAATAPATGAAPTFTDDTDYSSIIHPSIAEIIKLEEMPAVEPLESLTLRDMAELEAALQIGDTYNYNNDD